MSNYNTYYKSDYDRLKYKFKGSDQIEQNYSQAFQDLFVLSVLDGKKTGTYIEIGGDHPITINNSYLLEKEYDWKGISFELSSPKVEYYNSIRENVCICADATKVNYKEIFSSYGLANRIDYLQVDIEPSWQTLLALRQLPLDDYRFSVITFETDLYKDGPESAEECHKLLSQYGYELIIKNVANEGFPYENWYVDPNVVGQEVINIFKDVSDTPKEAINCVLKN
jgi:hypothetical protein